MTPLSREAHQQFRAREWYHSLMEETDGTIYINKTRDLSLEELDAVALFFRQRGETMAFFRKVTDDTKITWQDHASLPPGVSFDPLTGALSIAEGSAVKRVVVPSGVKVNLAALPYGSAPEGYEAVPMDIESCRAAQKSFEKSVKDLKKKLPRLYKNFKS